MAVQLRQIIEVPCEIDALSRLGVLRQLDDDALAALDVDPSELDEPSTEEEPASGDPDEVADEPYEPALSEDAAHRIDRAIAACLAAYEPRGAYKVFNPAICTLPPKYVEPAIKLVGTMMMFHGQSSYEKLRRATHCALMAATIGPERPEALPANADDLDRAIARACALALVESTADHVNADIVKTALDEELYTDDRLCPGVGDFPLESRSQFVFYTQSEQRLGLKLNADGAFDPPFSTVGVVGMYDPTQKGRRRACGRCKYRSFCSIRAIGMNCHGSKGSFKNL